MAFVDTQKNAHRITWLRPATQPGGLPTPDTAPRDTTGRSIWLEFQSVVMRQPDAPALTDGISVITFAEAHSRALALARRIAIEAPGPAPMAVLMSHAPGGMIAMLASLAAGRVTLLINPEQPADRIAAILADGRAAAALAQSGTTTIAATCPTLAFDPWSDPPAPAPGFTAPDSLGFDAPAIVTYTSGSSGQPKGVVHSQRAILYRTWNQALAGTKPEQERVMVFNPVSLFSGFLSAVDALMTGSCLVLAPSSSPRETLAVLTRHRVTALKIWPRLLNVLLAGAGAPHAFRHVHTIRTGGGGVLASDLEAWRGVLPSGCRLVHGYNQTEAGIANWSVPVEYVCPQAALPSGYFDPSVEYALLDATGQPVADGEVGALIVRGPYTAIGEWQDGRCIEGRIRPDPDHPGMRIVHTGDQVRLRAGGLVDVVARGDRMVKVLGNRVEPAEIEGALRQEAGVADAAVEARMNGDVATLYAFVCGVDGATPDRRAIMTSLRRKLPSYMVPRKLLAFPTLPKLPSGKIDRMRMLAMAEHDMDSPTDLTFLAARQANVGVGAPAP